MLGQVQRSARCRDPRGCCSRGRGGCPRCQHDASREFAASGGIEHRGSKPGGGEEGGRKGVSGRGFCDLSGRIPPWDSSTMSGAGTRLPGTPAAARRGSGSTRALSLCRRRCFAGTRRRAVATLWDARKGLDSWQDREPEGPVRPPPPPHSALPLPSPRPFSVLLPDSNEGLFSRGTPPRFPAASFCSIPSANSHTFLPVSDRPRTWGKGRVLFGLGVSRLEPRCCRWGGRTPSRPRGSQRSVQLLAGTLCAAVGQCWSGGSGGPAPLGAGTRHRETESEPGSESVPCRRAMPLSPPHAASRGAGQRQEGAS